MKDSLLVILVFSILVVILLPVTALFYSMGTIGSRLFLFPQVNFNLVLALIPSSLLKVILPALLIALFIGGIRMQKNPGIRIVSYIALGSLAFAVLFFAPEIIRDNVNPRITQAIQKNELESGLRDLSFPEKLIPVNEGYFYFEKQTNRTLSSMVIIKNSGPVPRISSLNRILFQHTDSDTIFLDRSGKTKISLTPKKTETGPFQPEPLFQNLYALYAPLQEHFDTLLWSKKEDRYLLCLLLVALVLSVSVFFRFSRWRIANIMLALLVLFGVLTLYNFTSFTLLPQARHVMDDVSIINLVPYSILVFFSGLFFLFDFILFPRKRSHAYHA